MGQQYSQNQKVTFNKGLLTEFSELNFPQEATVDELNCNLNKDGTRSRRLGLLGEPTYYTDPSIEQLHYSGDGLVHTFNWESPAEDPDLSFIVVQRGNRLYFYRPGGASWAESILRSGGFGGSSLGSITSINMVDFENPYGTGAGQSVVDVCSVRGALVVVSPNINPFYVTFNPDTFAITATEIEFYERDFEWQGNRNNYQDEVTTPTFGRKYDTANSGWTDDPLAEYISVTTKYPPLTHPWYSGKNSSGDFSVTEWKKIYSGTSIISNGHFIVGIFSKDRTADGTTETETIKERFSSVQFYAGRVFYGGLSGKVYFSVLVEDLKSLGNCYQVNDPTSEEISDLLDTDGGYIRLPDAAGVRRMVTYGASLLVFAANGVWKISGIDDVFRATEYSVSRVTSYGLPVKSSLTQAGNGAPFWWSQVGIHSIVVDENGIFREVNISRQTINRYWGDIPTSSKVEVTSAYNEADNTVVWMYPVDNPTSSYSRQMFLFFDIDLQAFYPWQVASGGVGSDYPVTVFYYRGSGTAAQDLTVVDESGDTVVDEAGDTVVATYDQGNLGKAELIVLSRDVPSDSLYFCSFYGDGFKDFTAYDYTSFLESAYTFISDLGRRKTSPYITVFLRQTETALETIGGSSTIYQYVRPSSLFVSAFWDFKSTPSSSAQQAYRLQPFVVDSLNPESLTPYASVVTSRLKLRGRGRSVRLRFNSETGKDFQLLGWETLDATNSGY